MRHIINLEVENHSGVLARISGLFSARGFNIESLSVARAEDEDISRMTLVARGDDVIGVPTGYVDLDRLLERALGAELTEHLGYEEGDPSGSGSGNSRNGYGKKRVITDNSQVEIEVPRDRSGTFEPQLIRKRQTRKFLCMLPGGAASQYSR